LKFSHIGLMFGSSQMRFLYHTRGSTTIGRTPLDEWSARRRDLYLTTHNTYNKQTSMPPGGIRTHDLSRRAAADLRFQRFKSLTFQQYFFEIPWRGDGCAKWFPLNTPLARALNLGMEDTASSCIEEVADRRLCVVLQLQF
jgi:hypothetical protein